MNVKYSALLFSVTTFFFFSCTKRNDDNDASGERNFYSPSMNRMAAEWEPALGTMIVWPLCIPHQLVIDLAKDDHLYTLVENSDTKKDAISWYLKWGIDTTHVTFIYATPGIDSWWVRDWGPAAVFNSEGKMMLADPKYIFSTPVSDMGCEDSLSFLYTTSENKIIPTTEDDNATMQVGKGLQIGILDLPYVSTGGNIFSDGVGSAFSTCILTNENKFFGVSEEKFFDLNRERLGILHYNMISNFEKRGIQHIDCFLKLLDEETILVAEPPKDHELHLVYDNIVKNELAPLLTPYGRPYKILRIKTFPYKGDALAAYTNAIVVNKNIYVPLFNIKEDSLALNRWREVMPGYTVKGYQFIFEDEPALHPDMREKYPYLGWNNGDALHCRTRAVWDKEMLFITAKPVSDTVSTSDVKKVYATIIDYSKKGLIENSAKVVWREKGKSEWKSIPMTAPERSTNFEAEISVQTSGTIIEYYISASSQSGRQETKPRAAPEAFYAFVVK